ncbi:MAG: hypothetical protein NXI30_04355 [bacterium]|nr:hypothetical protein [bacterium]
MSNETFHTGDKLKGVYFGEDASEGYTVGRIGVESIEVVQIKGPMDFVPSALIKHENGSEYILPLYRMTLIDREGESRG